MTAWQRDSMAAQTSKLTQASCCKFFPFTVALTRSKRDMRMSNLAGFLFAYILNRGYYYYYYYYCYYYYYYYYYYYWFVVFVFDDNQEDVNCWYSLVIMLWFLLSLPPLPSHSQRFAEIRFAWLARKRGQHVWAGDVQFSYFFWTGHLPKF